MTVSLIMHTGLADPYLANPRDELSFGKRAVSDNLAVALLIQYMGMLINIFRNLVFYRLLKHLPRSFPEQFFQSQSGFILQLINLRFTYSMLPERILISLQSQGLGFLEKNSKRIRSFFVIHNF